MDELGRNIDDKDIAHSDFAPLPPKILGDITKDSCVLVPARTNDSEIDEVCHVIFVDQRRTGPTNRDRIYIAFKQ
jgi:hypothetical protein